MTFEFDCDENIKTRRKKIFVDSTRYFKAFVSKVGAFFVANISFIDSNIYKNFQIHFWTVENM